MSFKKLLKKFIKIKLQRKAKKKAFFSNYVKKSYTEIRLEKHAR